MNMRPFPHSGRLTRRHMLAMSAGCGLGALTSSTRAGITAQGEHPCGTPFVAQAAPHSATPVGTATVATANTGATAETRSLWSFL